MIRTNNILSWDAMSSKYLTVRGTTLELAKPLSAEDMLIQTSPFASPTKWHLAHTTWFFERFVLREFRKNYQSKWPVFDHLFNSYYKTVGPAYPRPQRGWLSRPSLEEVINYRAAIDELLQNFCNEQRHENARGALEVMELGLNHEQQHQELILMDIKYNLFQNPILPAYSSRLISKMISSKKSSPEYFDVKTGLFQLGHDNGDFAFDLESPAHSVFVSQTAIAKALVTNAEYLEFIQDGGYQRPELWLDEGWTAKEQHHWTAPLYWIKSDPTDRWKVFTLHGLVDLDPHEPVSHVSYFEADAYARWASFTLPTESAWESVAVTQSIEGQFFSIDGRFHPQTSLESLYGSLWVWTKSPLTAYPGFKGTFSGLSEYNGKFMCNQFVLRGGSFATPGEHIRPTYRNFFYPQDRWQFCGIRLAKEERVH